MTDTSRLKTCRGALLWTGMCSNRVSKVGTLSGVFFRGVETKRSQRAERGLQGGLVVLRVPGVGNGHLGTEYVVAHPVDLAVDERDESCALGVQQNRAADPHDIDDLKSGGLAEAVDVALPAAALGGADDNQSVEGRGQLRPGISVVVRGEHIGKLEQFDTRKPMSDFRQAFVPLAAPRDLGGRTDVDPDRSSDLPVGMDLLHSRDVGALLRSGRVGDHGLRGRRVRHGCHFALSASQRGYLLGELGPRSCRQLARVTLCSMSDRGGRVATIKIYLNMKNPPRLGKPGGVENLARRLSVFMAPLYPWASARTQDPRRHRDVSRCTSAGFSVFPGTSIRPPKRGLR